MQTSLNAAEREAVDRICGDAEVIGLGEMTHGSKELLQARAQLLKHLIEHRDVRIIILETNLVATFPLNQYILLRDGTAREALSATEYWSTVNDETLELVEWLREYNRTHAASRRPVQVWGCDVQAIDPGVAELKRHVSAFAADHLISIEDRDAAITSLDVLPTDRDLYRQVEALIAAASSPQPNANEIQSLQSRRDAYMGAAIAATTDAACSLRRLLRQLKDAMTPNDAFRFERCVKSIEHAVQFYSPDGELARDRLMADNVLAVRSQFPGEKVAILAHNLHVMRSPLTIRDHRFESLGCRLRQELNDGYKVIGSAFHHGRYVSLPGDAPTDVALAEAHPPRDNTWEHHCQSHCTAIATTGVLLAFSRKSAADEPSWTRQLHMRLGEAGKQADYQDSFTRQMPLDQYDGLLFVSQSSGISILPEYFAAAGAKWKCGSP